MGAVQGEFLKGLQACVRVGQQKRLILWLEGFQRTGVAAVV